MPETGARFQYENRNLKKENEVENESVATTTKKIHILMKNLTMFKAVLQVNVVTVLSSSIDSLRHRDISW